MVFGCLLIHLGCQKEAVEPDQTYTFVRPPHFPAPTYTFDNNPITKAGFELGKRLFNDPKLSSDNSVACSNCHAKGVAFADPQHRLSVGVQERTGFRNAPALMNMAFMKEFFWDGAVSHLDFAPIIAIESEFEMNEKLVNVVAQLNDHSEYPALFREAFGNIDTINAPLLLHALSQFTNMMVSATSKYDRYIQQKDNLTPEELSGLELFEKKCATCHSGVLLTNQEFHKNGLDNEFTDIGRAGISEYEGDIGKFRVPSLRNVELTAPYMHDGRFNTLEEVLDHYQKGVKSSKTLSPLLRQDNQLGIELTEQEKHLIIEFLYTLTDRAFTSNPIL